MKNRALITGLTSLSLLLFLAGCSSDDSKGKSAGAACSAAGADKCQAIQMICASSGGSETCESCPNGHYAATGSSCAPIPGTMLGHDFGTVSLNPGDEITPCQSWTLNNETELWVNSVEMINDGSYHHSNWDWVPDTLYPGPDGSWDCTTRHAKPTDTNGFDEVTAVADGGGTLFAQSTQAKRQVQKFNDGAAVRLPPHVRFISGTHLLNVSDQPVTTDLEINIYTIDRADVTVPLAPFALDNHGLTIQPASTSTFTGACDFASAAGTPGNLDMEVYYVMPHYHALGSSFVLSYYGGAQDGQEIYSLGQFDSEAHGRAYNPPVPMQGSEGFRFTCGYKNPYNVEVHYGIGDIAKDPTAGEMCVMLGFGRSKDAFGAIVPTTTQTSAKNGVYAYDGTCAVLPIPFTQGQLGG